MNETKSTMETGKITIRDEGSTALLTAYTDDSVYTVDMAYTVYTIETALHC